MRMRAEFAALPVVALNVESQGGRGLDSGNGDVGPCVNPAQRVHNFQRQVAGSERVRDSARSGTQVTCKNKFGLHRGRRQEAMSSTENKPVSATGAISDFRAVPFAKMRQETIRVKKC